jgi:methylenetetrahydrofolate--tRNA-(uracil-5-)-methyltransferase
MQKTKRYPTLIIIGGGLAGCEAAWQAANQGIPVVLYEMRPYKNTEAHKTDHLAELVCSNSLGSNRIDRSSGLLKDELRKLGSILLKCADSCAVPAGSALAIDRIRFSELVTHALSNHPLITIERKEIVAIPPDNPTIIASGPLTSHALAVSIRNFTGSDQLYFFDAIAPIVEYDSIDFSIAFHASRYDDGQMNQGDYVNLPFEKDQYFQFIEALITAEQIPLAKFETEIQTGVDAGKKQFFESCLPIEVLAKRNPLSLAYGPLKPVGIFNPNTHKRPFAVVQLRQDNIAGNLYNMVGFQTNLLHAEQERVFRMIPGLQNAEFTRLGQMHRNTFLASPALLSPTMQSKIRPDLFFAGQLTGMEGYVGSIASGLLAGVNMARWLKGLQMLIFPTTTMIGALTNYICNSDVNHFQPMKANFGILPPLVNPPRYKQDRLSQYSQRANQDIDLFIKQECPILSNPLSK